MTEQELKELLALLETQGWNPRLCDTPVPYYDSGVPCGKPQDIGCCYPDSYHVLPRDLVARNTIVIVRAEGDSMIDAGIEDGDEVHVMLDARIHDGDQVVACINGESTLKSYYRDEEGKAWLVPCNANYDAIPIPDDGDVRILGKVVKCVKVTMATSFRYMQQSVRRTKMKCIDKECADAATYSDEALRRMLREVFDGAMVAATDWVAVYRLLVERCGAPSSHTSFARWVNALKPEEFPECTRDHVRRDDDIYCRPIYEWENHRPQTEALKRRTAIAKRLRKLLYEK